jgi:hypothetical protein
MTIVVGALPRISNLTKVGDPAQTDYIMTYTQHHPSRPGGFSINYRLSCANDNGWQQSINRQSLRLDVHPSTTRVNHPIFEIEFSKYIALIRSQLTSY